MSFKITDLLAQQICNKLQELIITARLHFSDNISFDVSTLSTNCYKDISNNCIVFEIAFEISLDTVKTLTKIEYYYTYNNTYELMIIRDDLNINLNSGVHKFTHKININYQFAVS